MILNLVEESEMIDKSCRMNIRSLFVWVSSLIKSLNLLFSYTMRWGKGGGELDGKQEASLRPQPWEEQKLFYMFSYVICLKR